MTVTVFRDCTLLDCTGADSAPRSTVIVDGARIARVVRGGEPDLPGAATRIDCDGRTVMPGLTDAHVHCAIVETDLAKARRESPATIALSHQGRARADPRRRLHDGARRLRARLGLRAGARARPAARPPRALRRSVPLANRRPRRLARAAPRPCAGRRPLRALRTPRICDSPDEMRRAAREILRTGAHGIKIMGGGGCMSPT
jgi:imidazolonepropionase-like amidohydrolase